MHHRGLITFTLLLSIAFATTSCEQNEAHQAGTKPKAESNGKGKHTHGPGGHDHGDHSHSHPKKIAGPNGGRIMTSPSFKCELFVSDDRKVRITFLDDDNKAVAVDKQQISIVCEHPSKPTSLDFKKMDDGMALISSANLPERKQFDVTITIQTAPQANPLRAKLDLDLNDSTSCHRKKYACICDHHHDHDHGHTH